MKPTNDPPTSGPTDLPLTMSSAMATTTRYHDYLWSFVRPYLSDRVLEIGVGFGQYTRRLLAERRHVLACDLDAGHLRELGISVASPLLETLSLDLEEPAPGLAAISAFAPGTIILLNVL